MSQRLVLLLIWSCGYLISICFLFIFLSRGWMLAENFKKDFGVLTAIFAPYLTPIVAFWFAKRHSPRTTASNKSEAFYVAVGMSIVFNLMVLVVIGFTFIRTGEGLIENNLDLAGTIGTGLTFLTGPAIGYYFGKTG